MRIIIPKKEIKAGRITISGEKAKYLISVLRCRVGDSLQVLDGEGGFFNARITEINNKRVTVALLEKTLYNAESSLNLILIQGILKGEKMDWVVQKTTELGVREIIPAITERSQIRHTQKVERWRKIAEEASRQSGRIRLPVIHEAVELGPLLTVRYSRQLNGFIFWEEGGLPLKEAILKISPSSIHPSTYSPVYLFIGPEGGFTKNEIDLAESAGLVKVSLGKRILRAETAAITSVALLQYLLGDLS